ncbi:adenylosuccinate synthetase [Massilia forsythiae]|uniref:Adenylosuccinate synthetase n=1 Tax=Massilia forsythiae TaxID=2728020 RepID=A0A7Z2VYM9_9BURK|nr:adenylosuccinate synthetase [Massilia forsythiae]QJE01544.1 adenylosuccinate synthetase [Massilia forsythiae]
MAGTATAVIGAGYGDEGKGLMTDYFAARSGTDGIVVRFNGGAQAGHTVTAPGGLRHVFSHFGSGTLAGAATFLARRFVCHPSLFLKEAEALAALGLAPPPVFVDERAPLSTLYDILLNQLAERRRGNARHGSCGMGFGETVERSLDPEFALSVADLRHGAGWLLRRLAAIRDGYVPRRLAALGIPAPDGEAAAWLASDAALQGYVHAAMRFRRMTHTAHPAMLAEQEGVVFEGAQGLLLDQERGAFPYVTRSHTGIRNALEVATEAGIGALDVTYVTRAYLTRHGAGPLAHELPGKPYAGIRDDTNLPNAYQGTLRFAPLDLDLLVRAVQTDFADAAARPGMSARLGLAVSCLDQVGQAVSYVEDGASKSAAPEALAAHLAGRLDAGAVYTAWGPGRTTVKAQRGGWNSATPSPATAQAAGARATAP